MVQEAGLFALLPGATAKPFQLLWPHSKMAAFPVAQNESQY